MGDDIQHVKKRAFLKAYANCGNITRAAEISGVDRATHYRWIEDEQYKAAFELAKLEAIDRLEEEARRRAVEGVDKPVFYQGAQCGTIREYSDTLLIVLLKGALPDKYKDRVATEHSGNIDVGVKIEDYIK